MPVSAPSGRLLPALERALYGPGATAPEDRMLVAFSAGPDSTALLWGLARLGETRDLDFEAAHVDHRLDPDSPARAECARRICRRLDVPLEVVVIDVTPSEVAQRGLEAAARRARYRALEEVRRRRRAAWILTAHHRDDQIETVLLRLLHGSGWQGLAGIPQRNGRILRPLLAISRSELLEAVAGSGIEPSLDPANEDPGIERSRLRHRLLPHLERTVPDLGARAVAVAAAAAGARRRVREVLRLRLGIAHSEAGASLSLEALRELPPALLPAAAALLHQAAGADYPPSSAAVAELARQLAAGAGVGGDAGDGWRWRAEGGRLFLGRARALPVDFTYTVEVPGEVDLPEISLRFRIGRSPVAAWMFDGSPTRTGLGAALRAGDRVTIRNRRPGDRLRPLGCRYRRKLKDVLIDRQVPRAERDRIPLVCVGDTIAWVPGVTIDERFRIADEPEAWLAELEPA